MTNEAKKRLLDVINACAAIAEFVAGKDFTVYEANRMLRSAVERQFEIIGEGLNKAGNAEPCWLIGFQTSIASSDSAIASFTATITWMTKSCGT
jgi:hypothetical protein